jgi:coatomer protein complex subunit gamma
MVQYHGVSLLYQIRQHDKLAVSKFITQLQKTNLRSSLATCLLIRYTAALLRDNANGQDAAPLFAFLQKMLRQKNEVRMGRAQTWTLIHGLVRVEVANLIMLCC